MSSKKLFLPDNFYKMLSEAVDLPRPSVGITTPSGAIALGGGQTSDVWGFTPDHALKLYRLRDGIPVLDLYMPGEREIYNLLSRHEDSGLPHMYGYGDIQSNGIDSQACGWALFDRIKGEPLSPDEIMRLDASVLERWVRDLVFQAVKMEICLAKVAHENMAPVAWSHDYASTRIPRIIDWALTRPEKGITNDDVRIAEQLGRVIEDETKTSTRRYINGDFNPPNLITDISAPDIIGATVGVVDPLISFAAPEETWRHQTLQPELADRLTQAYQKLTGRHTNERLLYAIGALTHLYISIAIPESAPERRLALKRCLAKVGLKT